MATTTTFYNVYKKTLLDGSINHDNGGDTFKVALVTSSYTPDYDSHSTFADITNEVSGTGYTTGGETIAGQATSQDNIYNEGVWDANDVTWSSSSITARAAVVYKDAATDVLVCYIDFGSDITSVNSDFTIQWNSEGVVNVN